MRKYTKLYFKFLSQYLKSLMEYKTDFLIGLGGFLITQAAGICFIYLIFQRIPHLNNWSFYQIMFIYGFAQIPRGIDHLFTDNLWMLSGQIIVKGQFDKYLLRPINPLFHLIAEVFQPDAFGELLVGIALVIISIIKLNISLSILGVFQLVVMVIFASVIYTSIKLFFASFAFWIKFSQAILYVNYSLSEFSKYPIGIYSKWIKFAISFVVPFAFTSYFPAGFFLDKVNINVALYGTMAVAIISFTIAYSVWLAGIKVYESSGS